LIAITCRATWGERTGMEIARGQSRPKACPTNLRTIIAPGIFALGVLLSCCPGALALNPSLDVSQYAHTAWRAREGFPNGQITALAQTPDGYLWLGTEFGLLRYDGVKAVPWQAQGQHLPDSFIRSLLVARDGTLWIGMLKGLASWKDGKVTQYKEFAGLVVDALLEDRKGTLWVGAGGFPNGRLCTIQSGEVECHGEDGSFGGWVESLCEDHAGNLWAATGTGLWRWNPGPPTRYAIPDLSSNSESLIESDAGTLLIASRSGTKQVVNGKLSSSLSVPGWYRFLLDHDGSLWIGTVGRGLVHVHHGRTDSFTKADGLSGDAIVSLFEDHEGNIWVATEGGLDRFRDLPVPTLDSKQGLSNEIVEAVLADEDGRIWIASKGGLNRWSNGRIAAVSGANRGLDGKTEASTPIALFQDDRGRIWISTLGRFGYLEKDQFVPLSGFPDDTVRAIAQDSDGSIWIAYSRFGLFRLSRNGEVVKFSWAKLGRAEPAIALAADPLRGGLWIGFFNGGLVYFKDGQIRESYTAADGLGEGSVNYLKFGMDGVLWASTQVGLSRFKNGRIATLSSKNGLPCNSVHWMMEDNAKSVWLYMGCGLVRFPRAELDAWATAVDREENSKSAIHAAVFTDSDGVAISSYGTGFSPRVAKSSDGTLWFTASGAVSVVDPGRLPFNNLPPPVHVEQITADHNVFWQNASGDSSSEVRLPPQVRDLEIDYTALSYVAPEKVHFRFKLEGWDRDWQDVGNRRQAFYNNLSPGNYRFRVTACNNSGVWNEAGTFLDFSIAPAYYQTNWFRLSCVIAFMAMLWGLYRLRLRQMAQQFNVRMEERLGERMRIARDLHDTLLQSFHGLLLRFQTISNTLPPGDTKQQLDSAIDRTALAVTEGRDAVQGLRKFTVTTDLPQAVNALGQELALSGGGDARAIFQVEVEGTPRAKHPVTRDEVYRITGEAIRNAFEHACPRKVEVEIWYGATRFRVRVRDDGRGIDPSLLSAQGRPGHFGLHGMRERAEAIGGRLEIWSEVGCGTEVELSIPAEKAYVDGGARRFALLEKLREKFHRKETTRKL
jgi:signal transduction histidine kinase/ligand-binding sensor domain-containing protein